MNILDPDILKELFHNHTWLFNLGVLLLAGVLTYYFIPKVIWIAKNKNLYKTVNGRSSHRGKVPSLGGIAFYISFVLLASVIQTVVDPITGFYLIGPVTIMFVVGIKDDLVVSTARVKLIGQLLATIFVVFSPVFEISNLHGFLGIYEIPLFLGYLLKIFIVVALINSYNLIDGINGLAGIIGIVISLAYAVAFSLVGGYPFSVFLSLFCVGALLAFLPFNFSKGDRRIFMGDSGSLMIGLIFGVLTINLLWIDADIEFLGAGGEPQNRLLFLGAVLFVLFFDTSRVIIIRLVKGRNPFKADRNHMHHILLDLGFSHRKASSALGALNVFMIGIYLVLSNYFNTVWLLVSLAVIYGLLFALCGVLKKEIAKNNNVQSQWVEAK